MSLDQKKMVKVLPFRIFSNERVVGIKDEPTKISGAGDSFLVATKEGSFSFILIIFFNLVVGTKIFSNDISVPKVESQICAATKIKVFKQFHST